jgi:DNA-directed RNA polymerases I, II, and III subunit RPABC2
VSRISATHSVRCCGRCDYVHFTDWFSSYGQDEPEDNIFDQDEPQEEFEPDAELGPEDADGRGEDDGDGPAIVGSDPNQQTGQKQATDADKKIPPAQRTTTPYMTKYERARVLGTRALQIR